MLIAGRSHWGGSGVSALAVGGAGSGSRGPYTPANMRLAITTLLGGFLACFCLSVSATTCDPSQRWNGCTIADNGCKCYYGCKTDLPFSSRKACLKVLREESSNACSRTPCRRGVCTQTAQSPGFTCKCEGTGYYGNYCERACPTVPVKGQPFPYQCVVI